MNLMVKNKKVSKSSDIKIRKFESADLGIVKKLIDETIDVCYSDVYPKEAIKFFKEHHCQEDILKSAKEGHTIVLERDGRIIGTGTIIDDHVRRVFVTPEYQKCGYGKVIMQKLEEKALSAGISIVTLCASIPSKEFYDSLGYVTLEETFLEVENGKKLDYYKMQKSLIKVMTGGNYECINCQR